MRASLPTEEFLAPSWHEPLVVQHVVSHRVVPGPAGASLAPFQLALSQLSRSQFARRQLEKQLGAEHCAESQSGAPSVSLQGCCCCCCCGAAVDCSTVAIESHSCGTSQFLFSATASAFASQVLSRSILATLSICDSVSSALSPLSSFDSAISAFDSSTCST